MPATRRCSSPGADEREARLLKRNAARANQLKRSAVKKGKQEKDGAPKEKIPLHPKHAFDIGKKVTLSNGTMVDKCPAAGCPNPSLVGRAMSYGPDEWPAFRRVVGGCDDDVCRATQAIRASKHVPVVWGKGVDVRSQNTATASDCDPKLEGARELRNRVAAVVRAEEALRRAKVRRDAFVKANFEPEEPCPWPHSHVPWEWKQLANNPNQESMGPTGSYPPYDPTLDNPKKE